MCGILFSAHFEENSTDLDEAWQKLQLANTARGPDAQDSCRVILTCSSCRPGSPCRRKIALKFFSSELRLRGEAAIVQPHRVDGDYLCWNGEVFDGLYVSPSENDGVKLFNKLSTTKTPEEVRDVFASIEGPYAFVYFQAACQRLFFARDPLGRRSLLKVQEAASPFILTSVSTSDQQYEFEELDTGHIFCMEFSKFCFDKLDISSLPIPLPRLSSNPNVSISTPFGKPCSANADRPPADCPTLDSLDAVPEHLKEPVDNLIECLSESVKKRVANIPLRRSTSDARVAVLFSGGIDSTVIAYLAHLHLPIDEPIDLLNVGFENPRKIKVKFEGNIGALPKKERRAREKHLTDSSHNQKIVSYRVPDRVTGLQEVKELRRLCPDRIWNFVEVNVPYEESQAARATIESLMLPRRTVMDMSLAMALYFASRGRGHLDSNSGDEQPRPYTSTARVLLNGLGSDELLGGYGRHRSAFNMGGWEAVIEELQLDIDRIPTRNLGRDDRVISSHGKETRHPFLSLSVVEFLAKLPVHYKMDPRVQIGMGDKMLLRLAARKLGLVEASARKKRAMQFGSHSARMEEGAAPRGDMLIE